MMYEELVMQLREAPSDWYDADLHYEAADAIEKLIEIIQNHNFLESLIKPRWIPVTERLPEPYVNVLAFDGEDVGIASYQEKGQYWLSDWMFDDTHIDVTHWMPLPESPKEEE